MNSFYSYTLDFDTEEGVEKIYGITSAEGWTSALDNIVKQYGASSIDNITLTFLYDSPVLELKEKYFKSLEGNVIY